MGGISAQAGINGDGMHYRDVRSFAGGEGEGVRGRSRKKLLMGSVAVAEQRTLFSSITRSF